MSSYSNYDVACDTYDSGRKAIAADVIAGLISTHTGKPIQEISLLDVGCGTGNYAIAMTKLGVKRITLFDGSEGMLNKAMEKMKSSQKDFGVTVNFKLGSLPHLPFGDNSFDALIMNQVIHHLESAPDGKNFPTVGRTFREFQRVLRPGGLAVVTWTTPDQQDGVWYMNLIPSVMKQMKKREPDLDTMINLLAEADIEWKTALGYVGRDSWISDYTDVNAPFRSSWRALDSSWELATEKQLNEALALLTDLKESGKLVEFFRQHDKSRSLGAFTILCAQKQIKKDTPNNHIA